MKIRTVQVCLIVNQRQMEYGLTLKNYLSVAMKSKITLAKSQPKLLGLNCSISRYNKINLEKKVANILQRQLGIKQNNSTQLITKQEIEVVVGSSTLIDHNYSKQVYPIQKLIEKDVKYYPKLNLNTNIKSNQNIIKQKNKDINGYVLANGKYNAKKSIEELDHQHPNIKRQYL